ncbi:1-phosphofructokinase [Heliorestis acidaminivorans]|uniref:Tagatose-6-phosphate kinase n=1 Tax=Heliorestis acidaminivorans TaxID=553427 RepID=A0A6I0F4H7_9FIRM|nr:1-phosphofructokinase [Heliorestis acidaminivorans]KAB2952110.1 1-phosphofructokinase [Heliorestis acidaminivorans]
MIVTITLNPAVDTCYYVSSFLLGETNRSDQYVKTAGGKGLNVSKVLKQLGADVIATGFLGGTTGQFIAEEVQKKSIISRFTQCKEDTRNCIAIIDQAGQHTEMLERGPKITEEEAKKFFQDLTELYKLREIQAIVASGSIPAGLGKDYYCHLIREAKFRKIPFILDTSGDALKEAIQAEPYLIKPNISEVASLLEREIRTEREVLLALQDEKLRIIPNIVISLGAGGAMARCDKEIYKVIIPTIEVKSPVGSGDAMVAGMAYEITKKSTNEQVLRVGTTCGILNAMHVETGYIDIEKFNMLYKEVQIIRLN